MANNSDTGTIAKIRSAGFFTKGMVYLLLGALTCMAAFGLGGKIASTDGVIKFLLQLPLGKALVGVIALGLFAYSVWRFYQMLLRPNGNQKKEKSVKTSFKRFRYFYSGVLYGVVAYSFARPLVKDLAEKGGSGLSSGNQNQKAALGELLSHDWGKVLLWILAIVVAGQAIWQFRLAYKAKFMKKIDNFPNIRHEYIFIRRSGRFGYSARGVVFGIISFFLIRVILQQNADVYKGTQGALQYLLSFSYGSILLGAVSLGLVGYGIFNIMVARHANLTNLT